jgi:Zn-dependent protease with chaperone function
LKIRRLSRFALVLPWVLGMLGGALLPVAGLAEPQKEKNAQFDAAITAEITVLRPAAGALFTEANQARKLRDHGRARDLYARVHEMVPTSSHPLRREGSEELALHHRARAIELLRAALAMEASAPNLAALSSAFSTAENGEVPPADRQAALDLAERAVRLDPDDFSYQATLAQAALVNSSPDLLASAAERLVFLAPQEYPGYAFRSLAAALKGDLDASEAALAEAHARGFSGEPYRSLLAALHASRPWYVRYAFPALTLLAAWGIGLLVLFSSGWFLSRATLRSAERAPDQASGAATGGDLRLRRVYRAVLWLSCVYYWLSIPVVALLVLAVAAGTLYGIFALGQIPLKLVVIIVVLLFGTLRAMAKGLFARSRDEDPGLRLAPDEEPRLRGLLEEVAGRIGTRPVDSIYLTPGTDLAVMERGGLLRQIRGDSERCLILGVAVLDGMTMGPLRAILAHEYGHFSNRDTAGGGFALSVRRSLWTMAQHLAQHGAAAWYNPAWLFVIGFQRVFLRVSQGASRLQEVLADRWASFAYGAAAFERGLRHVVERSIRFGAHAQAALGEVIETRQPLPNLYAYRPGQEPDPNELGRQVEEAIEREPSPYDSHPSPAHRIQWIQALVTPGATTSADDDDPVWSLFGNREAVETRLTRQVKENLRVHQGIAIPEGPETAAAG